MTHPLRIGLIGTGRIGQVHAASIAASSRTALAWVADPFLDGAVATAERFGGAHITADPLELLGSDEVDAVIVASPTPTHVDLIEAAIDAEVPVLCEKPIDLRLARVDALRAKAAAASTPVVLGFNRRFDPHFAALRRRVEAGEIGRLEQLTITSRDPAPPPPAYIAVSGGIFRDMTIHDLDTARSFVPTIVEVTAHGAHQFDAAVAEAGDYDAAVVTLRGADGELITITNSRHSAYGYDQRVEAFGPGGLLQVGNIPETNVRAFTAAQVEGLTPYRPFFLERYADSYRLELEAFADLVRGGENRSPTFEDGRAALLLADAAERSAAEGVSIAVDLEA